MRLITLILIFSVFFEVISYCQNNTPTVAPPSPHALGSSFSASVPVNQYNGLSSTNIPLMTLEGGTSSMNVQLNYVNGGIKVGQLASSVGLGWNHNAGGIITRIVRGLPDDCKTYHKQYVFCLPSDNPCDFNQEDCYGCQYEGFDNFPKCPNVEVKEYYNAGLLHMGEERYNDIVNNPLSSLSSNDREALGLGVIDTEPDLFTFNFHGYNGQFFFKPNGEIEVLGDETLIVEYEIDQNHSPASEFSEFDYNPTYEGAITQFKVIAPNGYEYIFNKRDAAFSASITIEKGQYGGVASIPEDVRADLNGGHNNYVTECSPKIPRPYLMEGHGNMPPGYFTAWHLTEIINEIGDTEFELEYEKEILTDHSQITAVSSKANFNYSEDIEYNCNLAVYRKNKYTFTNSLSINQRLKKITSYKAITPYEELVFQYNELRNDIKYLGWLEEKMGNNYQKAKLLNFINKRNLHQNPENEDVMLEAKLTFDQHQFFPYQNGSGEGSGYCEIDQRVIEHFSRPYLEEVQISGYAVDGHGHDVVLPPFILEYYNKNLPPRHSYNMDMWGYYNRNERGDFEFIVCEQEETGPPIYGNECDDDYWDGETAICNPEDLPPGFPDGWDPVETEYSIRTHYNQSGNLECIYSIWTRYEKGEKIPYSLLPKTYFYPKDPYNSIYGTEFSLWPRIGFDENNEHLWSILNPEGPERLPNESFAKNGSLVKITQPSGNFSEIELESNEIIDQSAFFENIQESFYRCIEDPNSGINPFYSGEVFSCSQPPSSNDVNIIVPSGETKLINIDSDINNETKEDLLSVCFAIYDDMHHSDSPCENCVQQWINVDIPFTVNDYGAPGYEELFLEVEVSFNNPVYLSSSHGTLDIGPHEDHLIYPDMPVLILPITPGNHSLKFNYNQPIDEFDYQCIEVKLTLVEVQEPIVYGKINFANGSAETIKESGTSQFYLEEGNYSFEMVDHSSNPEINGYFQHGAEFSIDVFRSNEEESEDNKLPFGGLRVKNIQNYIVDIGTTNINYDYVMENGTTSGVSIQPPLVGALKSQSSDCQIYALEKMAFLFSVDQGASQLLSDYAVGYRRVIETTEDYGINEYYFDIPSVFGFSSFGCENNSCLYTVPTHSTIGISNKYNFLNVPFVPASGFDYYRSTPRKVLTKDLDGTLVKKVETDFETLEIKDFFAAVIDLQISNNSYQLSEMIKECDEEPEWWQGGFEYEACIAYINYIYNNEESYIEFEDICGNTNDKFKWQLQNSIQGFKGRYSIKSVKYLPVKTEETIYYPGHPLVTTTLMTYTDDDYILPHTTTTILPDGREFKSIIEYAYQSGATGADLFVNAGRPWTPVANLQYLDNNHIAGSKSEFKSIAAPYSQESYIRPSKTFEFIENEWVVNTESISYDPLGRPYRWRENGRSKDHMRGVDYKGNTYFYGYFNTPPNTSIDYYPNSNRIKSITDPRGNEVVFEYDGLGRLIKKESRDGQYIEHIDYDFENFEVTNTVNTDVNIPPIITKYNGAGNVVSEVTEGYCYSGSDWIVSNVYDQFGRIKSSNDPEVGGNTVYFFNQGPLKKWQKTLLPGFFGRFISTEYGTNQDGEVPGYSGGSLLKTTTTDLNFVQTDRFETTDGLVILNRIHSSEGPVETHYSYDQYSRLNTVTQPNGEVFTYEYVHLGGGKMETTKEIPGGGIETITTDRFQKEIERITALGDKFEYHYDANFDLLDNIKLNNQTIETFEYYTSGSDLRRLKKNTVSTLGGGGQTIHEYEYDDFGRIEKHEITWPTGATDLTRFEGYDHRDLFKDKIRSHQSHNRSESFICGYKYDHGGRLVHETLTIGSEGNKLAEYIYDDFDRVITKPLGSEDEINFLQNVDYEYHPLGWLERINSIPYCELNDPPDIDFPDDYYTDGSNAIEFEVKLAYDLIGLILGIGSRFDLQLIGYINSDSTKHQIINKTGSFTSGGIRNPNGGFGTPAINQDSVLFNSGGSGGSSFYLPGYTSSGNGGWYDPGWAGYDVLPSDPGGWGLGSPGTGGSGTWGSNHGGSSGFPINPSNNSWYNPGVITLLDSLFYNYAIPTNLSPIEFGLLLDLIMNDLNFLTDSVTSHHLFRDWLAEDVEEKLEKIFRDLFEIFEDCQGVENDDLFAMEIHYTSQTKIDHKPIKSNFNGNVSWVRWMSLNRDDVYYYGFEYDDLSRLKNAYYSERQLGNPNPTLGPWKNTGNYDVDIDYEDLAGNISHIKRFTGANGSGPELMDDLSMTYNGNRLNTVTAGGMGNMGFRQLGGGSFEYDDAGNVTDDYLRDLTIVNNELNLPVEVTAIDGTVITIQYDATGNKLSETITVPGGPNTEKLYYAGLEVINDTYYQYSHSQGRYMFENEEEDEPSYFEYVITDHLGNGRVWFADLDGDGEISREPEDHEIRQEKHYYPFGLHMDHPDFWVDYPEGDRYQYNSIENVNISNALLYAAHYRTLDPGLGRWMQVDPAAEKFYGSTPYNSMGNSPIVFADPEGDEIITAILVGAIIGASVSGATTVATNAVAGNPLFQGFGQSVAFGALGGAIGAGISGAFAGTAFGQSAGFSVLNNFASNAATSAAFGQDITLGSALGSLAGGLFASSIPGYTGLKGSSFKNAIGEALHNTTTGAVAGAISGGVRAAVDGTSLINGVFGGLKYGAIGGASQTGLNIITMGTAYAPDNLGAYGEFGRYKPVYRRGTFITRGLMPGSGIALGRNLVTNGFTPRQAAKYGINGPDYNSYLRAHETAHFDQQRRIGFGSFYGRTGGEYLSHGLRHVYGVSGTLEYGADRYAFKRIGYYYRSLYNRRTSFP